MKKKAVYRVLSPSDRRTLTRVRDNTQPVLSTVREHTRLTRRLSPTSLSYRLARYEDVERSVSSLLSTFETHGVTRGDHVRIRRLIDLLSDTLTWPEDPT